MERVAVLYSYFERKCSKTNYILPGLWINIVYNSRTDHCFIFPAWINNSIVPGHYFIGICRIQMESL